MLDPNVFRLDCSAEAERIASFVRDYLRRMRRKGVVVALSGGVDSSVVAALAVRAVGKDRVYGLLLPEAESAEETPELGRRVVEALGIRWSLENITPALEALGCYRRRDAAIREVIPEYGPEWRCKVVLPSVLRGDRYRLFEVVAQSPAGEVRRARLTLDAYLGILAANSFKQRVRKMLEYHWADRLHYAVAGTPNLLEYDQGFFVKNGDGAADLKPIAHLYKSQVYQLAEFLDLPDEIRRRPPTTDTFSLPQTQDEFYFSLPWREMDLCLYALDHGLGAAETAPAVGLTAEQVELVFADIRAKREAARYLHAGAETLEA
jgi:NAD+ synthase